MGKEQTYRRFLIYTGIVAMGLWLYIHGHDEIGGEHPIPPLDRWLFTQRGNWVFREWYALLLLALGAWGLALIPGGRPPVFNTEAERFPQNRRRIDNPYSIHWRFVFTFDGRRRKGWINLLEPFRGLLIMGSPGSGKSYYVVRPLIEQQIKKGFTMFVYDFKYDDLSRLVYRCWLENKQGSTFHLVHFDDLDRSQRCNPLHPATLSDLAEGAEAARVLLLGLNRDWIRKQGDFWVESAINFFTAVIWFLRRFMDGQYCTLPHAIELMQAPYDQLFSILRTEPEIEFLINPFVSAYQQNVMPQLEGQVAGAKISLARLTAPHLYYILSGNDFGLDINDPKTPRIVCMGNSPRKQEVYGAVLSLYISRLVRQVNRPGCLPCSLVFDEFPTLYFNGMDTLLATARSNRVATTMVVQDMSQLKKEYGRDQAEVLLNITGNLISGQVSGESARQVSERFGRILQERRSHHAEDRESLSYHLDAALPPSRISTLSSGEMVGVLSDGPAQPLEHKLFHGKMIKWPEPPLGGLPKLKNPPTEEDVARNYKRIKDEVQELIQRGMERLLHEPGLKHLIVKKKPA
jgi:hypothetical protein